MHIVDGALSLPVLATGGALAVAGVGMGLRRLDPEQIPQTALLSAVFFVASLVHVPVGPSSVHLVLNGLLGLVLGWAAFPAIFIALLLQLVFFGFGGLLVLGVNTFNLAYPAVACYYLCSYGIRTGSPRTALLLGTLAGALAIVLSAVGVALALALSDAELIPAAQLVLVSNVPIMVIEGFLTGAAVVLVRRVKPQVLAVPLRAAA